MDTDTDTRPPWVADPLFWRRPVTEVDDALRAYGYNVKGLRDQNLDEWAEAQLGNLEALLPEYEGKV